MRNKNLVVSILVSICILFCNATQICADQQSFDIDAKSALLMEPRSGKILYQKNPHEKLPPASVTKIMTILLIYDAIDEGKIKLNDTVTISEHAADMGGSQIFLEPFEQQTVADLLKSIVVASANDAAVAMAEYVGGSEENFVKMMNERAKKLCMKDTHFVNACGLDTDLHLTSANDIALMSRELINKYPQVFELTKIWMDTITHKTRRGETKFGLSNTNRLIKNYSGATGLKTGSTSKALFCISATAQRDGMNLISVIMGAPNPTTRFGQAAKLLDYGFMNYKIQQCEKAGTIRSKIKVNKGESDEVNIAVKDEISIVVPKSSKSQTKLDRKINLPSQINAPVEKGKTVGQIIYFLDGKQIGQSDLITTQKINKATLKQNISKLIEKLFA